MPCTDLTWFLSERFCPAHFCYCVLPSAWFSLHAFVLRHFVSAPRQDRHLSQQTFGETFTIVKSATSGPVAIMQCLFIGIPAGYWGPDALPDKIRKKILKSENIFSSS